MLGAESYGIDVLKVREIIRYSNITSVPQLPSHVRGVINLRGRIIPVTDLRLRLGVPVTDDTAQTCIIVVHVTGRTESSGQMGVIVGGVEEVVNISAADIEETPDFGSQGCADYILGMAKVKGTVKALLDTDRILGSENTSI